MSKTCGTCGEIIRRHYSICSDGEDDCLLECGCPNWGARVLVALLALAVIVMAALHE